MLFAVVLIGSNPPPSAKKGELEKKVYNCTFHSFQGRRKGGGGSGGLGGTEATYEEEATGLGQCCGSVTLWYGSGWIRTSH
jgi:hypothetical protein